MAIFDHICQTGFFWKMSEHPKSLLRGQTNHYFWYRGIEHWVSKMKDHIDGSQSYYLHFHTLNGSRDGTHEYFY